MHISKDEKKFITLFDLIDSSKNDVTDVYLMKEGAMSSKQLIDTRYYLYLFILKCLRIYNSGSRVNYKLGNYLQDCENLFEKDLYKSALKTIHKARKLAEKYYKHTYLVEIFAWERRLYSTLNQFEDAKHSFEKRDKSIKTLDQENTLGLLGARLNLFYRKEHPIRSAAKKTELKKYKNYELLNDVNKLQSIHAKHLYYNFVSLYANAENNYKKSYNYINKWRILLESDPEYLSQNQLPYLILLNNLSVSQISLNKYAEAKFTLNKIYTTIDSFYRAQHMPSTVVSCLFKAYNEELNIAFETLNTKDVNNIIIKSEKLIDNYRDIIGERYILEFYNTLGILFFVMAQYKKALKWIHKILYQEQLTFIPLMNITWLMNVMIHYDLGDLSHVDYLLKTMQRKEKNKKQDNTFGNFFLNFIAKRILPLNLGEKEILRKAWMELKKELLKKYGTNSNDEYWLAFVVHWIESKIEQRPFADIIAEKH